MLDASKIKLESPLSCSFVRGFDSPLARSTVSRPRRPRRLS